MALPLKNQCQGETTKQLGSPSIYLRSATRFITGRRDSAPRATTKSAKQSSGGAHNCAIRVRFRDDRRPRSYIRVMSRLWRRSFHSHDTQRQRRRASIFSREYANAKSDAARSNAYRMILLGGSREFNACERGNTYTDAPIAALRDHRLRVPI